MSVGMWMSRDSKLLLFGSTSLFEDIHPNTSSNFIAKNPPFQV